MAPPTSCPITAGFPPIGGLVNLNGRNQVLLIGGDVASSSAIAETWVFSSGCWSQLTPAKSLSVRDSVSAAFDPTRGTVVLYGGRSGGAGQSGTFLHDTWTWDGGTWNQVSTGGPALINAVAAYDPISKAVILFGPTAQGDSQTWAWTGVAWTLLHPAVSPSGRDSASMTFDSATGQLVMFGGEQTVRPLAETWTWDGATWHQLHPAKSPAARLLAALGPNSAGGPGLVLYGGTDFSRALHDTWIWDGASWNAVTPSHAPPAGVGAPVATDTTLELVGGAGEIWAWSGSDWYRAA